MICSAAAHRYKLSIVARDETGDTNFIVFGKWAQRMIKKQVDTLIASNPHGFLPDDIVRLHSKYECTCLVSCVVLLSFLC
jgi:replication factor A1